MTNEHVEQLLKNQTVIMTALMTLLQPETARSQAYYRQQRADELQMMIDDTKQVIVELKASE